MSVAKFLLKRDKEDLFRSCTAASKPASPVHRHYGLARACSAEHSDRAVPVAFDNSTLRRMQENAPVLQRGVQHGFEFEFVIYEDKTRSRIFPQKSLG